MSMGLFTFKNVVTSHTESHLFLNFPNNSYSNYRLNGYLINLSFKYNTLKVKKKNKKKKQKKTKIYVKVI